MHYKHLIGLVGLLLLNISALYAATYSGNCGASGANVKWSYDDQTKVLTISGSGAMANYGIKTINNPYSNYLYRTTAPYDSYDVKSLIIAEGVTKLGNYAFAGVGFRSISMPSSLTEIGENCFQFCTRIEAVRVGKNVTTIGAHAFECCHNMKHLLLPNGLKTIGANAFASTNKLQNLVIPKSVTAVGEKIFYYGDASGPRLKNLYSNWQSANIITAPDVFYWSYNCTLVGYYGTKATYQSKGWSNSFTTITENTNYVGVDLGLSVRWMDRNVGASGITDIGTYWAWGDTYEKTSFTWSNYDYGTALNNMTKYCNNAANGNLDKITILDLNDDPAAESVMGALLRTPTWAEWNELFTRCTWTETTYNGTAVWKVTGPNGNSIYLPKGGYKNNTSVTAGCYYWTSDLNTATTNDGSNRALYIDAASRSAAKYGLRYVGMPIRAVCTREWPTNTLTVKDTPTGSATSRIYNTGESVTLTAATDPCYTFKKWSNGSTSRSITVTVTANATYTAQYEQNTYTVTVTSASTTQGTVKIGSGTASGSVSTTANCGGSVTFSATPKTGYHFVKWSDGNTNATRTVTVNAAATYTASFAINTYTLTVNSANTAQGTVTGGGTYNHGATATLKATPKTGYHFVKWSDGNTNASRTVTVNAAATYTASFAINTYTLTVSSANTAQGTVTGGGTYNHGATATLKATPKTGYHFVKWSDGNTNASRTVTVTAAATYTASFAINTYTLTVNSANTAQGTVSGGGTYNHGATATLKATPATGYHFVEWSDGNTNATRTVTVNAAATYTASFAINTYTINPTDIGDGVEIEDGNWTDIPYGSLIKIYANPTDDCYQFEKWSDNNTDNPRTYLFEGTIPFTVVYELKSFTISIESNIETSFTGTQTVACGTQVTLHAVEVANWHFDHWSDGNTETERLVEVTSDTLITAYYAANCGEYAQWPVVSLYEWLLMLDVQSLSASGYKFGSEKVCWYRVQGEPDSLDGSETGDDIKCATGYYLTIDRALPGTGDYYAVVDVSDNPTPQLCNNLMRSEIVHYSSEEGTDRRVPVLVPTYAHPGEQLRLYHLNPMGETTVSVTDITGRVICEITSENTSQVLLQAANTPGNYQVVVSHNGERIVIRYTVVK